MGWFKITANIAVFPIEMHVFDGFVRKGGTTFAQSLMASFGLCAFIAASQLICVVSRIEAKKKLAQADEMKTGFTVYICL